MEKGRIEFNDPTFRPMPFGSSLVGVAVVSDGDPFKVSMSCPFCQRGQYCEENERIKREKFMSIEEIRDEIKLAIENEKDEENLRLLNNARNDLDQIVARQTDTA